jgi:GntR family transcriptional regulator, vanillate catabolism transcriptional regulator
MIMENQLEHYDLSHLAYQRIKERILSNSLKSGEKLIQEKLAAELGVSRMPLHKAFQMLENELLVETVPRKGVYVREFDIARIIDAFECREAIECVAARRAATRISHEEVEYLFDLFAPFADNYKGEIDLMKYENADRLFHKKILEISGNKILQGMELFGNVIIRTYQRGLTRGPAETYPEHIAIIEALAAHDKANAEKLIRVHFQKSIRKFLKG